MKQLKITQGDWTIDGTDIIADNGKMICQVYDASDSNISNMDMEVVNANAKIIASSPSLAKVGAALLAYSTFAMIHMRNFDVRGRENPELREGLQEAIDEMKLLLTKISE